MKNQNIFSNIFFYLNTHIIYISRIKSMVYMKIL
ncbi:hypothetical protein PFDG_00371 [Plasmodium falciparum Dd2]|uniref:Uncharacterized protein n=1 Tax=Plasmodium falciparum (isolate Dd2) TaxID=57267 RepID=A0A0L7LXL5_PLAF4|nr:hypothetical protein PFDG_00371 [Plasmodium falciparum Dd2]